MEMTLVGLNMAIWPRSGSSTKSCEFLLQRTRRKNWRGICPRYLTVQSSKKGLDLAFGEMYYGWEGKFLSNRTSSATYQLYHLGHVI